LILILDFALSILLNGNDLKNTVLRTYKLKIMKK